MIKKLVHGIGENNLFEFEATIKDNICIIKEETKNKLSVYLSLIQKNVENWFEKYLKIHLKNICKEVSCNINKDIIEHFNNAVNYYINQLKDKFRERYPHLIEHFWELIQDSLLKLSSKFKTEYINLKTEIEQKYIEEWKVNALKEIEKFMNEITAQSRMIKSIDLSMSILNLFYSINWN